jgi:hypothetical protein
MKAIEVKCVQCGAAEHVKPSSPAAPMLTALEKLRPKGWSYQIGFFAMLTGEHHQLCPVCNGNSRKAG